MWGEILTAIGFGIIFLIVITIIEVKKTRDLRSQDVEPNEDIIDIDWTRIKFTDGFSIGNIKTKRLNKNGTYFIEFYPFDNKQGLVTPLPTPKSLIVKKEFLKESKRSNHRNRIETIPRDKSQIPEEIRNTIIGDYYSKEGLKSHLESVFSKAIPEGDEALNEFMKDYARGNLTKKKQKELDLEKQNFKKQYAEKSNQQTQS